jgi:hypothetical protein
VSGREERIGLNEAVFREVNERLEDLAKTFGGAPQQLDLVCECGNATCEERIGMSTEEYEQIRSDPHLFAVYPGHEEPRVESVVAKRKGYVIVSKNSGTPERIAEETDPRR